MGQGRHTKPLQQEVNGLWDWEQTARDRVSRELPLAPSCQNLVSGEVGETLLMSSTSGRTGSHYHISQSYRQSSVGSACLAHMKPWVLSSALFKAPVVGAQAPALPPFMQTLHITLEPYSSLTRPVELESDHDPDPLGQAGMTRAQRGTVWAASP